MPVAVTDDVEALADRAPGADEDDPYADVDIDALPEWWQRGIREHRAYGLRPYRPPQFADGTLYPPLKRELAERLGIDLTLICYDVEENVWDVLVAGDRIGEIERRRSPEGYSVIDTSPSDFEELVREAVDGTE